MRARAFHKEDEGYEKSFEPVLSAAHHVVFCSRATVQQLKVLRTPPHYDKRIVWDFLATLVWVLPMSRYLYLYTPLIANLPCGQFLIAHYAITISDCQITNNIWQSFASFLNGGQTTKRQSLIARSHNFVSCISLPLLVCVLLAFCIQIGIVIYPLKPKDGIFLRRKFFENIFPFQLHHLNHL